jgi:hypothetical protein
MELGKKFPKKKKKRSKRRRRLSTVAQACNPSCWEGDQEDHIQSQLRQKVHDMPSQPMKAAYGGVHLSS